MSEPDIIQATDETGAPQPEHLAPAELDPYFIKPDGTKVTGSKTPLKASQEPAPEPEATPEEPVEAEASEDTEAEPDKEDKPEEAEKPRQTIGDAWREVKQRRRELAAQQNQLAQRQEQIEKLQAEVEQSRQEMRANFRGWLAKNGMSLRQLVEEDLKAEDADPRDKELRTLRAELSELKELVKQDTDRRTQVQTQQERQQEVAEITEVIQAHAEDYPYLAAYPQGAAELVQHWHAHKAQTGEELDAFALFEQADKILEEQDAALAAAREKKQQRSQATEKPATVARATKSRVGKQATEEPEETQQEAASTLTNRTAAQRASGKRQYQSNEERARAIGNTVLKLRE